MRPDSLNKYPGRTYKHYIGTPVFEFGHGLSYSKFTYSFDSQQKPISLIYK